MFLTNVRYHVCSFMLIYYWFFRILKKGYIIKQNLFFYNELKMFYR